MVEELWDVNTSKLYNQTNNRAFRDYKANLSERQKREENKHQSEAECSDFATREAEDAVKKHLSEKERDGSN